MSWQSYISHEKGRIMKRIIFIISLLLLCGCKEKDESLACFDIIYTCKDAYSYSSRKGDAEKSIEIWDKCYDVSKKYNCSISKLKTVVFGFDTKLTFKEYQNNDIF